MEFKIAHASFHSMVVCHCKAIFEREVRALVRAGADSRPELARACGAGTDCGGCRPVLDQIIAEESGACGKDGRRCERTCLLERGSHAPLG